ncbi:hypothetical protein QBC37DRAFT_462362 [Rhypophila decipiens]|uniref:Rhodopsin domain-containing protein n=1 Tax=Rhypophila decipiens TaxID=261697 RepID=A0AAN7B8F7_9PEZI|nr:hypothetical protein QBC37DRAFT_462362 [Rhypophila decipiens]
MAALALLHRAIAEGPPGPPQASPTSMPTEYCDLKYAGLYQGPIPDQGPRAIIAIWSLIGAATLFVALRFYCKIWRGKPLWWDDFFMALSWICFLVEGILTHRVILHGFGRYPCDIPNPEHNFAIISLEGNNLGATFTILAIMWSKTAFAVVLLRLVQQEQGRKGIVLKTMVWFTIGMVNILMGLQIIMIWVKCNPPAKAWNPMLEGSCWDQRVINFAGVFSSCLSGAMDLVLSMLPWALIWNLRMSKREKWGIGIAMSMGIFASATSFVKGASILALSSKNFTYDACPLLVWSAAEVSVTMMATSIPVLRVLFRDLHSGFAKGSKASGSEVVSGYSGFAHTLQRIPSSNKSMSVTISREERPEMPKAAFSRYDEV